MIGLDGKSWAELEVGEHENGTLTFPASIRRRTKGGEVKEEAVVVCVPRPQEHLKARAQARAFMRDLGLDDKDLDKDQLDSVEKLALLALCVRTRAAPHSQHSTLEEVAKWDEGTIRDLTERINTFKDILDPRDTVTTEEDFWFAVAKVAKKGHLLPLADIAGHEVPSLVVRMAREALLSPTARSFVQSSETSTPEPSASPS
jgi:hypothetical protein